MEYVAASISVPKSPNKIIPTVLPVVVVEPTIAGTLVGIKAKGVKAQDTIWTFVTIDKPPIEFKWWCLICFPSWA